MPRVIRELEQGENGRSRALYEEVFAEDSRAFVDYYYQDVAERNRIFVAEEDQEILATLHLNPYRLHVCDSLVDSAYIVAVATKASCRHQGLMRKLITASLEKLYEAGHPFTWLMPASEAIYRPFDFRFFYTKQKQVWEKKEQLPGSHTAVARAETKDLPMLARFAERTLAKQYEVYAVHDQSYFESLQKELSCEGGAIYILWDEHKQNILGYFLAMPELAEVWEVVADEDSSRSLKKELELWQWEHQIDSMKVTAYPEDWSGVSEQVPAIMGRIVCLDSFVKCLRAKEERHLEVEVKDPLISKNNGIYEIRIGQEQAELIRQKEKNAQTMEMTIVELFERLMQKSCYLNEIV